MDNSDIIKRCSPNRFIEHYHFTVDKRQGHLIIVSGTYYDMGLLVGRALGQQLSQDAEISYQTIKNEIAIDLKRTNRFDEDIQVAMHEFDKVMPIQCQMDMLGMVDGCAEAGYPLSDSAFFKKLLVALELGEQDCTLFAAQPPMTLGHTHQLGVIDYFVNEIVNLIPTVIVRIPQDSNGKLIDIPYASFDFMGNVSGGVVTGVNEQGVVFSQHRGKFAKNFSYKGLPLKCLIQQVLSKAKTAKDAIQILKTTGTATSRIAIISDPLQNKSSIQLIFMGPDLLRHYEYDIYPETSLIQIFNDDSRFYKMINGSVYWTDMVGRTVDDVPLDFFQKDMYELLKKYEHKLDIEKSIEIAQISGHDLSCISAVFDTTTMEARVAFSDKKNPSHYNDFISFKLNDYFSFKKRLL